MQVLFTTKFAKTIELLGTLCLSVHFLYFSLFFENIFKQNPLAVFCLQLSESQDCTFISAGTFSIVLLSALNIRQILF